MTTIIADHGYPLIWFGGAGMSDVTIAEPYMPTDAEMAVLAEWFGEPSDGLSAEVRRAIIRGLRILTLDAVSPVAVEPEGSYHENADAVESAHRLADEHKRKGWGPPTGGEYAERALATYRAGLRERVAGLPEELDVALGYSVVARSAVLALLDAVSPVAETPDERYCIHGERDTSECVFCVDGFVASPPSEAPASLDAALDVERLAIAMNRAYTYGTGTAEQVAAEYARLTLPGGHPR